jgi:predicted AAA+ superfamily ATPase
MGKDIVKVLTGIRRCGKSVMLEIIQAELEKQGVASENFLSINFESMAQNYAKSIDETYSHIQKFAEKKQKIHLFLDEIQELQNWEKLVNSCLIDFKADIYITGSNAKMLSGELATYLGGRYVEFHIYPFSFSEAKLAGQGSFEEYAKKGGMPFLYQNSIDEHSSKLYLNDIYSSVLLKDIVERYNVRDVDLLKRLLLFFIANIGHSFSATSVIKYLKNEKRNLSAETIYNYIDYCKNACLLHLVGRKDISGKKMLKFQEKIYIADHGIREAVYGNNMKDIEQVLENIVYMELLRKGYDVSVGKVEDFEIDFVASRGAEQIYIQVCYLLASPETAEREFSPLLKIRDNFPKFVISTDKFDMSREGIVHKNIEKWLQLQ